MDNDTKKRKLSKFQDNQSLIRDEINYIKKITKTKHKTSLQSEVQNNYYILIGVGLVSDLSFSLKVSHSSVIG